MKLINESLESTMSLSAFVILTIVSKKAIEEMLNTTGTYAAGLFNRENLLSHK